MFSQSFESMINMVNIPPLVCFLMGSKDRRQSRKLEIESGKWVNLPLCSPE